MRSACSCARKSCVCSLRSASSPSSGKQSPRPHHCCHSPPCSPPRKEKCAMMPGRPSRWRRPGWRKGLRATMPQQPQGLHATMPQQPLESLRRSNVSNHAECQCAWRQASRHPHCSRNFILFISLPCCCPRPLRIACHEANAITVISIHHTRQGCAQICHASPADPPLGLHAILPKAQ